MQNILTVNGLSKNYGVVEALKNLSLTVKKGDVYGILGPNGSGKTTTLGILLGVTNQTSGSYSWFDNGNGYQLRKRIGSMLDKPNFYPHLNAVENLRLVADIKEIKNAPISEKLELTDMLQYANRKFQTYSTGMKQRLALAAALINNPEVLVLDEPTNGLDPEGIADVRNLIKQVADEGITVLLASHLLDEVQKVCSHVVVLQKGNKLFEGQVQQLVAGSEGIEIGSDTPDKLAALLSGHEGVVGFEKRDDHFLLKLKPGQKSAEISAFIIKNGINITHFAHRKGNLEEEFLQLLAKDGDKAI